MLSEIEELCKFCLLYDLFFMLLHEDMLIAQVDTYTSEVKTPLAQRSGGDFEGMWPALIPNLSKGS
jgi:hypothetical protein